MFFHFINHQSKFGFAEKFYWRNYVAMCLVSLIILLQFVWIIEALLFAWLLVDLLGGALTILFGLDFIGSALSTKLSRKA